MECTEKNFRGSEIMSKNFKEHTEAFISEIKAIHKKINSDFDIKMGLCLLETLFRKENDEEEFIKLIKEYSVCLKAIPLLLAIETNEIYCFDEKEFIDYKFDEMNRAPEEYVKFMKKTGLFDFFQQNNTKSLVSYIIGLHVGMLFSGENEDDN